MAVWPDKFVILRDNFKETLGDRTISSTMDVGPAKKRRRTMLISSGLTFSIMITQEIYEEFKKFYYDNDVGTFDFKRPDSDEIVQVRFADTPVPTWNETMWIVNVNLEILP